MGGVGLAQTRHDWWHDLAGRSAFIASLSVPPDEPYWDLTTNQEINADAYNLSGCTTHNAAIARWVDGLLAEGVSPSQIEKLLVDLTSRNTYGAFSELAAYGLLLDATIPFGIQIPMKGSAILNPNGTNLDGELRIGNSVYFDIKAFGLHEHLSKQLGRRLSAQFPTNFVAISGSSDLGVEDMTSLLGKDFRLLVAELAANRWAQRGKLDIRLQPKRCIQSTTRSAHPYELAENNADYAFRFAKQFVRRKPFILIFVIHPWLGGLRLSTNFASDAEIFMRSFARRTFIQFRKDRSKVFNLSRGAVSRLLSGIMFINASQQQSGQATAHVLFLNPYAKNPMSDLTREQLVTCIPNMHVDDFAHDAY